MNLHVYQARGSIIIGLNVHVLSFHSNLQTLRCSCMSTCYVYCAHSTHWFANQKPGDGIITGLLGQQGPLLEISCGKCYSENWRLTSYFWGCSKLTASVASIKYERRTLQLKAAANEWQKNSSDWHLWHSVVYSLSHKLSGSQVWSGPKLPPCFRWVWPLSLKGEQQTHPPKPFWKSKYVHMGCDQRNTRTTLFTAKLHQGSFFYRISEKWIHFTLINIHTRWLEMGCQYTCYWHILGDLITAYITCVPFQGRP